MPAFCGKRNNEFYGHVHGLNHADKPAAKTAKAGSCILWTSGTMMPTFCGKQSNEFSAHVTAWTILIIQCEHTQGAEVTGQLRVNGKVRHLPRCTLEDKVTCSQKRTQGA